MMMRFESRSPSLWWATSWSAVYERLVPEGGRKDLDLWAFRSRDITPGSVGLHLLTRELV